MKRNLIHILINAIGLLLVLIALVSVSCSNKGGKSETAPSDEVVSQETEQEEVDPILKLAKVAADADRIFDFQEGLAGFEKGGKIGVVNSKGDIIVPPTYDNELSLFKKGGGFANAILFFDGMAVVRKNGKYGYIDKNGKEVVPCSLEGTNSFSEGFGIVIKNGKYGVIDKTGKQIVPYKYDYISEFCDGAALVGIEGKFGFINENGEEIVPLKYVNGDDNCYFSDGLAMVVTKPEEDIWKYGYVNKSGKEVIEPIYDEARRFQEGLAVVKKDDMYGYIDTNGKEVIPFLYDTANDFVDGIAVVSTDSKYQIIDNKGKAITKPIYDYYGGISEGLAFMGKDDLYGLVDKNGKEIIPFDYSWGEIDKCQEGFIRVNKNGKWGYLDKNGKQVIPCIYDKVGYFSDGFAVVSKGGVYGYIDKEGKCTLDISDSELKSVITNKKEENEKKERAKEAEKERKKLEEQNTSSSSQVSGDVSSILYECQNEITAIQREIEEACRTFVVLGSQDVDMYKYTQMKSTFLNGVNNLERKADKAFDKCAKKLKDAGYPDAVKKINEEKRQFHSAIYSLTTRATQQTDLSY